MHTDEDSGKTRKLCQGGQCIRFAVTIKMLQRKIGLREDQITNMDPATGGYFL